MMKTAASCSQRIRVPATRTRGTSAIAETFSALTATRLRALAPGGKPQAAASQPGTRRSESPGTRWRDGLGGAAEHPQEGLGVGGGEPNDIRRVCHLALNRTHVADSDEPLARTRARACGGLPNDTRRVCHLAAPATCRPNRTRAADFRQRHLGCGRARFPTERRVSPALRAARALLARLAAGLARDDRRRLRQSRRALRQRDHRAEPRRALPRCRPGTVRAVTAQPLPALDPAFADHAPVAGDRERALHAARALRRCAGPAGDGARAGPGAGSARRVPWQPHVPRAVALRLEVRGRAGG